MGQYDCPAQKSFKEGRGKPDYEVASYELGDSQHDQGEMTFGEKQKYAAWNWAGAYGGWTGACIRVHKKASGEKKTLR